MQSGNPDGEFAREFLLVGNPRGAVDHHAVHVGVLQRQDGSRERVIQAHVVAPDQLFRQLGVGGRGLRGQFPPAHLEVVCRQFGVLDADQDRLAHDQVGLREIHRFIAFGGDRHARYDKVEFALLQGGEDAVPGRVHELRHAVDALADRVQQVDVEPDDLAGRLVDGLHRRVGGVRSYLEHLAFQVGGMGCHRQNREQACRGNELSKHG